MSEGKKYDQGKPRMSLIPANAELELAKVLTFGAEEYGPGNWRKVDRAEQRYMDAALRHLNAARSGERSDSESGLNHLGHAAACVMFMLELQLSSRVESMDTGLAVDASSGITVAKSTPEPPLEHIVDALNKMDTDYLEVVREVADLSHNANIASSAILRSRKNGTTVDEELLELQNIHQELAK